MTDLDTALAAYVDCAIWAGLDWGPCEQEDSPISLGENYGPDDVTPEALAEMRADLEAFIADAGDLLAEWTPAQAGHDLYLTRNHHGAGFWDRGKPHGDTLTEMAHVYGAAELSPGSDGRLYLTH